MELTELTKDRIDGMTFEELLREYRFEKPGSRFWAGPSGTYAIARMRELKTKLSIAEQIETSKRVGYSKISYRNRGGWNG